MTLQPEPAAALDALVSGKRRVERRPVLLPARVRGVHAEFDGSVHDLSMDGALVRVPISTISDSDEPLGPAEQFALLERHFRDSFDLQFTGSDVVVEAQVVRLLVTADDDGELALGCSFVQPLSEGQQRTLGLLDEDGGLPGWGEATLQHELRWSADPARPTAAFLLDETAGVAGPLFVGPVTALGRSTLLVRLRGSSREEVQLHLGDGPVELRVMRGSKALFVTPVELVTTRYSDTPPPGVDVLLACADPVPRAVRKHFRRA